MTSDTTTPAYYGDGANQLEPLDAASDELEAALVNARKIGAAVGVVMATNKLTYEQAFAALSMASQRGQEKLRDVADRVILTGSTASWPN